MQKLSRVSVALATALAAGFLGARVGFLVVRLVVQRRGAVEGPPAGVLLVLVVAVLALIGAVFGLLLSLPLDERRGAAQRSMSVVTTVVRVAAVGVAY
jgi:hypothetical protein